MWLAWQGLIRKRATRTIEGTLWMVVAATAAIALIGQPADFTGVGTTVSNGVTGVLNTAFARLPAPTNSNCLPVAPGDPQSVTASYAFTSGNGLIDENANELWSVLVCKPWLWGELGTTQYNPPGDGTQTVVNTYGRQLLWSQAYAANETPTTALLQAKQSTYAGIAAQLQQNDPAIYPLFQGDQWTTRLEIAFGAMFAALVAGLLILLIALTLIVLKLGFLLLLVAGPFFLIIGTHPGFGRIIAIRWFEMLVGVLMKQVAIAIVLSVLLYCYSLIMGTSDEALPWALKILMIALVTVAVFIYRKPFTHLFSAVGYGTLGSTGRAEVSLRDAGFTFRRNTLDAAGVAIPGVAGYRAARWARRNPGQAAAVAADVAGGAGPGTVVTSGESAAGTGPGAAGDAYASRFRPERAPPRGRRGRPGEPGFTPRRWRRGPGPEPEHARDRERRAHAPAARPAAQAGQRWQRRRAPSSAAASWSRGAGRSAAAGAPPSRSRPTSGGAPLAGRTNGTNGTGSGARQPAPAWPGRATGGWSGASAGAGPRQRPAAERQARPAAGRQQRRRRPAERPAQRKRLGSTAGHAVLAAPDPAGQVTGGHRGTQPPPAQRGLRPRRHRARRARLLPRGPGPDPLPRVRRGRPRGQRRGHQRDRRRGGHQQRTRPRPDRDRLGRRRGRREHLRLAPLHPAEPGQPPPRWRSGSASTTTPSPTPRARPTTSAPWAA